MYRNQREYIGLFFVVLPNSNHSDMAATGNPTHFNEVAEVLFRALAEGQDKAAIVPLVSVTNERDLDMRRHIGGDYYLAYIVVSHDPHRPHFSRNCGRAEALLIYRLWEFALPKPSTHVVNLAVNPSTGEEAVVIVSMIRDSAVAEHGYGTIQEVEPEDIESGDWDAVRFLSPYLRKKYADLVDGTLFASTSLRKMAEVQRPGVRLRETFTRVSRHSAYGSPALWGNRSELRLTMSAGPDCLIVPRRSEDHRADDHWKNSSRLLLASMPYPSRAKVMAVMLREPVIGSLWTNCRINAPDSVLEDFEKGLCLYMNSSLGILSIMGKWTFGRNPKARHLSLERQRELAVPDLPTMLEYVVKDLAETYDGLADRPLLPLPLMYRCPVRSAIDNAVSQALDLNPKHVAEIRLGLASEPTVHGGQRMADETIQPPLF